MSQAVPLLEVVGAGKTFAGTKALDSVSLSVRAGEIVAVAGQNGSGKSTLVKILAGIHEPDPGTEIRLGVGDTPGGGHATELHFIHQDLGLIDMLTTVENLDLSRRLGGGALAPVRAGEERRRAEELVREFGVECDVTLPIGELPAAERAIVAIVRALGGWTHDRNVLILDEPTASLHGKEATILFDAVKRVAASGAGVVFISHRLDEIFSLADRVVVLRDGLLVADHPCDELDHDELIRLIAGREGVQQTLDREGVEILGSPVLSARGLSTAAIRSLDLDLYAGEILGIAGVLGSGREEVAGAMFGVVETLGGTVDLHGRRVDFSSPREAIAAGMAMVPADRLRDGAVMTMSAQENTTLPRMRQFVNRLGGLNRRTEQASVRLLFDDLDVRPPRPDQSISLFSGGNQQKIVLAKWLRNKPTVLLLDEPTQGVDVGAKASIYEVVAKAARNGAAVLVCSSDSRELARICDRVLVLRDGLVVTSLTGRDLTEENLIHEELGTTTASTPSLERSRTS